VLKQRSLELLKQALRHPSIESRYFSVDNKEDIVELKDEDPDKRVERFTRWAVELSVAAVKKTLQRAKVAAEDVSAIIVNTCTGYLCPGIATYCLEPLGLRPGTLAFDLVGSGCGGAIANLMVGAGLLDRVPRGVVVCVSVEICTATFQMDDDPSLLISNAIFGDGAAALLLWHEPKGYRLFASASRFLPQHRDEVRYIYKNGQLHNQITARLPGIIYREAPAFIRDFLGEQGLAPKQIGSWALHPGGDKMIVGLQRELSLSDTQLAHTRAVLKEFGNMSSPTVLFILERIMQESVTAQNGEWCLACAYGAGLSMHACLLKRI
jgi:alkylresorcinol/alkylpyrone synthase